MAHCKAFILPTFYEGFGIPPLEAAGCGAPELILSNIPCLKEIYGEHACYLDPMNPIADLVPAGNENVKELLDQYSWKISAERFLEVLNDSI